MTAHDVLRVPRLDVIVGVGDPIPANGHHANPGCASRKRCTAEQLVSTTPWITEVQLTGYTVEYAIPLASVGASSGATVGFDIAINDNDDSDQTRDAQLFWYGSAASWNNPSTWGSLALGATSCSDVVGAPMASSGCCSTSGGGFGGTVSLVALVTLGLRRRRR